MAEDSKGKHIPTMEKRYRPCDVIRATGISRGQFCNRALMLGIKRDRAYTLDEVYRIVSYLPPNRVCRANTDELRNTIADMLKQNGSGVRIETDENGKSKLVY